MVYPRFGGIFYMAYVKIFTYLLFQNLEKMSMNSKVALSNRPLYFCANTTVALTFHVNLQLAWTRFMYPLKKVPWHF